MYHTGMTTYQLNEVTSSKWQHISKPAQIAERRLISAILDGTFAINHLPGERELAEFLGHPPHPERDPRSTGARRLG